MALDATIVEVPKPPAGRLPFLRLLARLVSNPVASWGRISTTSRSWSAATLALRRYSSPILSWPSKFWTKATPSSRAHSTTMSSAASAVGGCSSPKATIGAAKAHAAPLFRAEALLSYVPAFAAACGPVLARWRKAEPGSLQIIGRYDRCGHAGAAGHQVTMLH